MARSSVVLRRILMATTVAITAVIVAPTIATAAPDIAGSYSSRDANGVPQTMTIQHSGTAKEYFVRAESPKSDVCGGMAASASGLGTLSEDGVQLTVQFSVTCMVEMRAVCAFEAVAAYDIDPASGMLRDDFQQGLWQRTGTPA